MSGLSAGPSTSNVAVPPRESDSDAAAADSKIGPRPSDELRMDTVCAIGHHERAMARVVGINHVAIEVGDLDEALEWYGQFFEFQLRGPHGGRMAFIDIGDQFIALAAGRSQPHDGARHFGLVVDDKEAIRAAMKHAGITVRDSGSLDFNDPWGNHVQVVDYREIQFTKAPEVLRGMLLDGLGKNESARQELRDKGLAG
jgi:catechol 2,3-dioxygenase-like lactoylglutathione lyase family enzyme